jgi:hypothetical protein
VFILAVSVGRRPFGATLKVAAAAQCGLRSLFLLPARFARRSDQKIFEDERAVAAIELAVAIAAKDLVIRRRGRVGLGSDDFVGDAAVRAMEGRGRLCWHGRTMAADHDRLTPGVACGRRPNKAAAKSPIGHIDINDTRGENSGQDGGEQVTNADFKLALHGEELIRRQRWTDAEPLMQRRGVNNLRSCL